MSVNLVVFDIAGTTVEDPNGVGGCLQAALLEVGVEKSIDEVNAVMGIPKPVAIAHLLSSDDPDRVGEIHDDFRRRMIEYYRTNPAVREVPGTTEVFRTLAASGMRVALDTGFDREIVDVLLERLGWGEELLDATVTSDEVERGRPFPDMVFRAMELCGVDDVTTVAKVGDTPSDLQEGTAAGCGWVIGVTAGTHRRDQLEDHPHTHLVESVRDVPALFTNPSN